MARHTVSISTAFNPPALDKKDVMTSLEVLGQVCLGNGYTNLQVGRG